MMSLELLKSLSDMDLLVLYVIYQIYRNVSKKASQKAINKVVAYCILVDRGLFSPLEGNLLSEIKISHFGWIVDKLRSRLKRLKDLRLIKIIEYGRDIYAVPALKDIAEVEKLLSERVGVENFERIRRSIVEALKILKSDGIRSLTNKLDEVTGTAGIKYAFVKYRLSAREFIDVLNELRREGERLRERFKGVPTLDELERIRHKLE